MPPKMRGWSLRARDGDAAAFSRLYERYARMIHGMLLARVSRLDVEDLVQDVFLDRVATPRQPPGSGRFRRMAVDDRAESCDGFSPQQHRGGGASRHAGGARRHGGRPRSAAPCSKRSASCRTPTARR